MLEAAFEPPAAQVDATSFRPSPGTLRPSPDEAALAAHRAEMAKLLCFVEDGGAVANRITALCRLFGAALDADGPRAELVDQCYLVVDILETMAARLSGFEEQARAGYDHFLAGVGR